jgi:putative membrane protein/RND superfamily putative drug exporter
VPFGLGSQPQFISTGGQVYQYAQTTDKTLSYKAANSKKNHTLSLTYTGQNKPNSNVVGYEQSREQVGTTRYVSAYKNVPAGTERYVTGTERYQTGTKSELTGYKNVQVGTEKYVTGTEKYVIGTESYQTGTKSVLTGYKDVQVGTEKYVTGTERYVTGTERYQTGTEITGYNTTVEKGRIDINRELDGRANGGAVGDILDGGTSVLMDANKASSFFTGATASQYKTTSLLGEDNKTNGEGVDLFKKANSDDMYVAGDPVVGGKGNNYDAKTIVPDTGYMTMFEDGTDAGRKVTINAHVDSINPQGNRAFTEYGFVIQDDQGQKTTAVLSGGQLKINGQALQPGQEKIIGDSNDPVAKFYYASMPGGENGANEQRLVFESYEKPTAETRQKMLDAGANPAEVDALRSKTQASFGFRIPDGKGSFRSSAGVAGGMATTSNGVKTYYDAHFAEPDSFSLETTKYNKEPIYGPVYGERPTYGVRDTYGERGVFEKQPQYEEQPVYGVREKYGVRDTYGERGVFEKQPQYEEQPVYGERPTYGVRDTYGVRPKYEKQPQYEEQPVYGVREKYGVRDTYGVRPKYEQQPQYEKQPVYGVREKYGVRDTYGVRPKYEQQPQYEKQPVYGVREKYGVRQIYKPEPVYSERPVYQDISKPIYGTDYGVKIQKDSSYSKPPVSYPPVNKPPVGYPPVKKPPVGYPPVVNKPYVYKPYVYRPSVGKSYNNFGSWNPYFKMSFYELCLRWMRNYRF